MDNESSELLLSAANIHLEKYRFTLYEAYEDENGNTQPTGKIGAASDFMIPSLEEQAEQEKRDWTQVVV